MYIIDTQTTTINTFAIENAIFKNFHYEHPFL